MKRGLLILISGPAGSGKGSVIAELRKSLDFFYSVSATTRAPRKGDVEGVTYLFVDRPEFERMIKNDELLEYAEYVGNYYGTPKAPVVAALEAGRDVVLEIETVGALKVKSKMPEAISVMLLPPSGAELRRRLENRGTETPDVIERRMATARAEVSKLESYDYVVINETDRTEEAAKTILGILEAETRRTFRNKSIKENYFKQDQGE